MTWPNYVCARIDKKPFSDDLKENVCVFYIGFRKFEIYPGVKLFSALYVNTALVYINRLGTDRRLGDILSLQT